MSNANDPVAWIVIAEEDYNTARAALRRQSPWLHTVCFHAQQTAEKYLKAILTTKGKTFPKTHDLLELSNLCAQAGVIVPVPIDSLDVLSDHAVQTRYPADAPTIEDAREAFETAQAVRKFARKYLNVK
jgi:HEPN domain-containing protein